MTTIHEQDNYVPTAAPYTPEVKPQPLHVEPTSKGVEAITSVAAPTATNYYNDTISSASAPLPQVTNATAAESVSKPASPHQVIESHYDAISQQIEEEFRKSNKDFEKLQSLVYKMVMLMMRQAAKSDQEYISEMKLQIKAKAVQVQGTYNTWPGLTVTVLSAGISVFGGVAGLTPLFPSSLIAAETARTLGPAAQSIGMAGQGVGSIGQVFNSHSEARRGLEQTALQALNGQQDDKKGAKQGSTEAKTAARNSLQELNRLGHDTAKTMMGG